MSFDYENRRNAAEYALAGGGLVGAGQYANYRTERRLRNSGKPGLWDATKAKKLSGTHARYMASKLGSRSLQVTGFPLAAAGVYHMVKPADTKRLNVKQDLVAPTVRNVVYADQVKRGTQKIAKQPVDKAATEQEKIYNAKRRAKNLSRVSGTLGLAALTARSPEIAAMVTRNKKVIQHAPKFANNPKVVRWMSHEPKATKISNTLGIGAVGVGSVGSFNFARLQGLENKREKAAISKRDDAFLRQYRDHISTDAERGYKHLKAGVNSRRASAVAEGGLGAGLVGYAFKEAKGGKPGLAALTATGGVLSLRDARMNAKSAQQWNAKKKAIQNRAYQRAQDGVYGRDRNVTMAKALVKAPRFGLPKPKGINRMPGIRDSYVMRTRSGKIVSVRGSIG